jgi:heme-degrading monooxygenase HmoA
VDDRLIARIWRTEVDPDRADEYERFAREVSLPMFRRQQGYAGVMMLRDGTACQVITLWRSREDVAALDQSPLYRETVQHILRQGFLQGDQMLDIAEAHLIDWYRTISQVGFP